MLDCSERRELMGLSGRRVDPAERLHILEVGMLGALVWQSHVLVAANLRDEHNSPNLLNLWIFGRTHTVHVTSDLDPQV